MSANLPTDRASAKRANRHLFNEVNSERTEADAVTSVIHRNTATSSYF